MELATVFPSKYVKASDLQGREVTVVISDAVIEEIGTDRKLVLLFQHKEKGMVCNRTNADTISELYGTNTDGWIGKEIILFSTRVNFEGRRVDAIRVRAPQRRSDPPPQRQAAPTNGNGPQHVVNDRGSYKTLETVRRPDPIEEMTGAPTRNADDEDIPF